MCTVDVLYCQHFDYLTRIGKSIDDSCDGKCGMQECVALQKLKELKMDGQILATGTKKDEGKARWDLLPLEVINAVADILTRGAVKYAPRNWEQGITYGRVFAGVMRHLTEWWICKLFGRDGINHVDGPNSHIDHAICGLMFLSAYEKRGLIQFDDRPMPIIGVKQ